MEDAATHSDTNYSLGSVLNHVMLHQTVIGQEAKLQMQMAGEEPDVVIGCFGGGSNFGGLALPYVLDRLAGKGPRILAIEPSACPSLTKGSFTYDYRRHRQAHAADQDVHAGATISCRRGSTPAACATTARRRCSATCCTRATSRPSRILRLPVFEAAVQFARTEGILPAPESSHAIRAAMDEALAAREEGRPQDILFCLSGHGHFDLASYESYLSGQLQDYEYPGRDIEKAMAAL